MHIFKLRLLRYISAFSSGVRVSVSPKLSFLPLPEHSHGSHHSVSYQRLSDKAELEGEASDGATDAGGALASPLIKRSKRRAQIAASAE